MWKMNLIRVAINSNRRQNHGLTSLLGGSPRRFSTEAEQPIQDTSVDPFLQTPTTGHVYGRLSNIGRYTTKNDIVNLLEGSNLRLDDIKVDYNRSYAPTAVMIQFPSRSAYDAALRAISRKGRLFRLDKSDRSQWDLTESFDGKAIILQGIPRNALIDDLERFLSGCQYDGTSIQMFARQSFPDPIRMALVRFPSQTQATHAFITKNRGFCLNNQILVRVLQ